MFNIILNNNIFIFIVGCQIYTCFILMKIKYNNENFIDSLLGFIYMIYKRPISMLIFFIIYSLFSLIIRAPIFYTFTGAGINPYVTFIFTLFST
jgi:hypothetical protein